MKYIYKIEEGFGFGFKADEINEILDTDVLISDENYNKFFELQSSGKQLKIKDINGVTFDEIFEEVVPIPPTREEEIKMELEELDKVLTRFQEDTWVAMGIDESKLPQIWQDRLREKRNLREELKIVMSTNLIQ